MSDTQQVDSRPATSRYFFFFFREAVMPGNRPRKRLALPDRYVCLRRLDQPTFCRWQVRCRAKRFVRMLSVEYVPLRPLCFQPANPPTAAQQLTVQGRTWQCQALFSKNHITLYTTRVRSVKYRRVLFVWAYLAISNLPDHCALAALRGTFAD